MQSCKKDRTWQSLDEADCKIIHVPSPENAHRKSQCQSLRVAALQLSKTLQSFRATWAPSVPWPVMVVPAAMCGCQLCCIKEFWVEQDGLEQLVVSPNLYADSCSRGIVLCLNNTGIYCLKSLVRAQR